MQLMMREINKKASVEDLAICGGRPSFATPLHVGSPLVPDPAEFLRLVNGALERNWLTNGGPLVTQLEAELAKHLNVRHCVATCNGTIALELAIRALDLRGEVIVPSFTFVATAHALQWQEITPIFCDIRPDTHTIDPDQIERLITPRTTGIIGVHVWGSVCDVGALEGIARRRGLALLFDAAHAFGCAAGGRSVGNFGDAEIFSFHATKFFTTVEGGAIATNNDVLAEKLRLMRNFGFAGYDRVIHIGTNGKMNEMCAAMGLANLPHLGDLVDRNTHNHQTYSTLLAGIRGVRVYSAKQERWNHQYVALEVDSNVTGLSRDSLLRALHEDGVLARRYFYPGCHRMEPYRSYYPNAGLLLPATEQLCDRVLVLPTGKQVDADSIEAIAGVIRLCIANPERVSNAVSRAGEHREYQPQA